ncbi:MAG: TM0106 family RecB-like putative nuclease [Rectinemataceae bacterium]|nr:TM0106 family RecB-like putative nuclease [Rectinemataceae bacterium]
MTVKIIAEFCHKLRMHPLSYIFKPRRSRKKGKRPVRHSLELQALSIRTGKVHVEHMPELPRQPVEFVLDLEGVPDRSVYYLAGLFVCKNGETQYLSFWADTGGEKDEAASWSALVDQLEGFPDAPVYHYGHYEQKAFSTLSSRHSKGAGMKNRLVNVASFVYGRVYFPVRSNGLKVLGGFLGATWTNPLASGLQSLVWRHKWEESHSEEYKQSLIQYNQEDCQALWLLINRLDRIRQDATTDPDVELANQPKRHATEAGKAVHIQFDRILDSATENSQMRGLRICGRAAGDDETRKRGGVKGHQAYKRTTPSKANRVVRVQPKRKCLQGHGSLILSNAELAERTVIDLVFTGNGCRKMVTRYEGRKGRCLKCGKVYLPPVLCRLNNQAFGHAFQAWIIYQRIVLRLPYRIIVQVTEHLFGIGLSEASCINFLNYLAGYYAPTEDAIHQAILKSPFIHVDETKISIQGVALITLGYSPIADMSSSA